MKSALVNQMFRNRILTGVLIASGVLAVSNVVAQQDALPAEERSKPEAVLKLDQKPSNDSPAPGLLDKRRWSFQGGVALITESTIDDILTGDLDFASGDAEGEIYLAQVSYKLVENVELFNREWPMDLELPFVLGLVNERGRDPFMQYNLGLTLRWKRFPWNKWVYTNFETGAGLTYSQYVLAAERVMHPTRDRKHLEFYWPVQITIAHPRLRQHQLAFILHHHSGGTIFHRGGANNLGIGYRYVPAERD
jgi:hypothetical protein